MNTIFAVLLVIVQISTANAETCAECTTAYDSAKSSAADDATAKCAALTGYMTCLVDATSCPLVTAEVTKITTDFGALSCTLTDVCTCQRTYFSTDMSADDAAVCTAATVYVHCLTGKTEKACDGTSEVSVLATAADSTITGLSACAAKTDTCGCQITYAKADVTSDANKCTAATAYVHCLTGKTAMACDGSSSVSTLATAAETTIDALSTCAAKTDTCACQIAYAKAAVSTDGEKCTAAKEYMSCLVGKTAVGCDESSTVKQLADAVDVTTITGCTTTDVCDCEITYAQADISTAALRCTATKALTTCMAASLNNGCGASTTKTTVGTAAQTVFTDITGSCTLTATCQCEVDFNKASITSADKCTSATTLDTCLGAITDTAETSCDATTLAAARKTTLASVKTSACSAGLRIEGSLISLLMLLVSVLIISP